MMLRKYILLVPGIQCTVTFEGGCNEHNKLRIQKYSTKNLSPEDCFWKCRVVKDCAGFFIKTDNSVCVLYKKGCTRVSNSQFKYYSMDTCSNGNVY